MDKNLPLTRDYFSSDDQILSLFQLALVILLKGLYISANKLNVVNKKDDKWPHTSIKDNTKETNSHSQTI